MTQKRLSPDEFHQILESAEMRSQSRREDLERLLAQKVVYLFGYGGKGRTLAWQIAKGSDTKVIVYDSTLRGRDLAAKEGFATVGSVDDLRGSEYGVILGACQAQIEQAAIV